MAVFRISGLSKTPSILQRRCFKPQSSNTCTYNASNCSFKDTCLTHELLIVCERTQCVRIKLHRFIWWDVVGTSGFISPSSLALIAFSNLSVADMTSTNYVDESESEWSLEETVFLSSIHCCFLFPPAPFLTHMSSCLPFISFLAACMFFSSVVLISGWVGWISSSFRYSSP